MGASSGSRLPSRIAGSSCRRLTVAPRGYNRRTALERINNRIDNSFGFEHHFIRGIDKMTLRVGLAFAVMLAMALRSHQTGARSPNAFACSGTPTGQRLAAATPAQQACNTALFRRGQVASNDREIVKKPDADADASI